MKKIFNLYEANLSEPYFVVSAPEITLLENLGIRLGMQVSILNRYSFGGPVLLCVDNAYTVALGKDIATLIFVVENQIDDDTLPEKTESVAV